MFQRKVYSIVLSGVTIATAVTFLEFISSAARLLEVIEGFLGQEGSVTSASAVAQLVGKSVAATGGAAFTPLPLQPGVGAANFTAKEGSTVFSAEGTITRLLDRLPFNVLQGCPYVPTPEGRIWVAPSGIGAWKFPIAPASQSWSAFLKIAEIG